MNTYKLSVLEAHPPTPSQLPALIYLAKYNPPISHAKIPSSHYPLSYMDNHSLTPTHHMAIRFFRSALEISICQWNFPLRRNPRNGNAPASDLYMKQDKRQG